MARRLKRFWLAATAMVLVFGAGVPGVQAFEQGPRSVGADVDPDKFSAASKAAEVNSTNQQNQVPDVSGATKTVTGQGNSQDNAGMVIPDFRVPFLGSVNPSPLGDGMR